MERSIGQVSPVKQDPSTTTMDRRQLHEIASSVRRTSAAAQTAFDCSTVSSELSSNALGQQHVHATREQQHLERSQQKLLHAPPQLYSEQMPYLQLQRHYLLHTQRLMCNSQHLPGYACMQQEQPHWQSVAQSRRRERRLNLQEPYAQQVQQSGLPDDSRHSVATGVASGVRFTHRRASKKALDSVHTWAGPGECSSVRPLCTLECSTLCEDPAYYRAVADGSKSATIHSVLQQVEPLGRSIPTTSVPSRKSLARASGADDWRADCFFDELSPVGCSTGDDAGKITPPPAPLGAITLLAEEAGRPLNCSLTFSSGEEKLKLTSSSLSVCGSSTIYSPRDARNITQATLLDPAIDWRSKNNTASASSLKTTCRISTEAAPCGSSGRAGARTSLDATAAFTPPAETPSAETFPESWRTAAGCVERAPRPFITCAGMGRISQAETATRFLKGTELHFDSKPALKRASASHTVRNMALKRRQMGFVGNGELGSVSLAHHVAPLKSVCMPPTEVLTSEAVPLLAVRFPATSLPAEKSAVDVRSAGLSRLLQATFVEQSSRLGEKALEKSQDMFSIQEEADTAELELYAGQRQQEHVILRREMHTVHEDRQPVSQLFRTEQEKKTQLRGRHQEESSVVLNQQEDAKDNVESLHRVQKDVDIAQGGARRSCDVQEKTSSQKIDISATPDSVSEVKSDEKAPEQRTRDFEIAFTHKAQPAGRPTTLCKTRFSAVVSAAHGEATVDAAGGVTDSGTSAAQLAMPCGIRALQRIAGGDITTVTADHVGLYGSLCCADPVAERVKTSDTTAAADWASPSGMFSVNVPGRHQPARRCPSQSPNSMHASGSHGFFSEQDAVVPQKYEMPMQGRATYFNGASMSAPAAWQNPSPSTFTEKGLFQLMEGLKDWDWANAEDGALFSISPLAGTEQVIKEDAARHASRVVSATEASYDAPFSISWGSGTVSWLPKTERTCRTQGVPPHAGKPRSPAALAAAYDSLVASDVVGAAQRRAVFPQYPSGPPGEGLRSEAVPADPLTVTDAIVGPQISTGRICTTSSTMERRRLNIHMSQCVLQPVVLAQQQSRDAPIHFARRLSTRGLTDERERRQLSIMCRAIAAFLILGITYKVIGLFFYDTAWYADSEEKHASPYFRKKPDLLQTRRNYTASSQRQITFPPEACETQSKFFFLSIFQSFSLRMLVWGMAPNEEVAAIERSAYAQSPTILPAALDGRFATASSKVVQIARGLLLRLSVRSRRSPEIYSSAGGPSACPAPAGGNGRQQQSQQQQQPQGSRRGHENGQGREFFTRTRWRRRERPNVSPLGSLLRILAVLLYQTFLVAVGALKRIVASGMACVLRSVLYLLLQISVAFVCAAVGIVAAGRLLMERVQAYRGAWMTLLSSFIYAPLYCSSNTSSTDSTARRRAGADLDVSDASASPQSGASDGGKTIEAGKGEGVFPAGVPSIRSGLSCCIDDDGMARRQTEEVSMHLPNGTHCEACFSAAMSSSSPSSK